MSIERIRCELTGGPGGNGVSTFYFLDAAAAQPALKTFMQVWRNGMPDDVTITVPGTGDVINEESGDLTSVWSGGTVGLYPGIGTSTWAAGVGFYINWFTAGVKNGRRVRGRTFIAPLMATCFTNGGTPDPAWVDAIGDGASALVSSTPGNMVVWSRPRPDPDDPDTTILGSAHPVTNLVVPARGTSLVSRRS